MAGDDPAASVSIMFALNPQLEELIKDMPGVMDYIHKLQRIIERHIQKINKLKAKIRESAKETKDASVQTVQIQLTEVSKASPEEISKVKTLADDIKEAAEMALQNTGFVYEETSGMYYDYNTGYYYNAEYGLYYDSTNGTYMKYNQDTQAYEFHSQVAIPEENKDNNNPPKEKRGKGKRKCKNGNRAKESKRLKNEDGSESPVGDVEEGECSDTDSSSGNETSAESESSDISKQWPPCMRVIVESSNIPKIKTGSLHIITYDGGTLGREGDHSIVLPDLNTSKHHLRFTFDKDQSHYVAIDLGSRNGTLLNGKRMSSSKQESEPMEIVHGSRIQIGSTVLLCHIHDGSQTCGHCEPGLIQADEKKKELVTRISRSEMYKKELKNLKKICGVDNYDEDPKLADGYEDRAQKRRETVGSQNAHEKTEVASVDKSITKENKGFKLLSKMGWKEGQALGKDGDGRLEPVIAVANQGKTGVGCSDVPVMTEASAETSAKKLSKKSIWTKTQARFQNLPDTSDAFDTYVDD